ncbi:unnamed protein product [Penicillium salamii]|nr:unnamed protein product [Penicillium salamii]CAG8334936.1 unnamed protein product [Penicillium salamii]
MAGSARNPQTHSYEPAPGYEESFAGYKRHSFWSLEGWLLELATSIVALCLLAGIIVIFIFMDGDPLSDWEVGLSPNAWISILTTACAALFMHGVSTFIGQHKWLYYMKGSHQLADLEKFDEASRGPWGSFKFLLNRLKNMIWSAASIGALITILQLTFTPFTQQVIQLLQRDVTSAANTAILGYTHNYNASLDRGLTRLDNSRIENYPVDPGMQGAIIQGLYGIDLTESFTCPGACQWNDSYISLGFKAECKDVTKATMQTATCNGSIESLQQCNMTTPAGVNLTSRTMATDYATVYAMNAFAFPFGKRTVETVANELPEIVRFGIYRSTVDSGFRMQDINITDCALSLTAYEYTDAKANGSSLSFGNKREVNFGVKNPWKYTTGSGSNDMQNESPHLYTNETINGNMTIPALGVTYLNLYGLRNFFQSTTIVTEWVLGNFVNTNSGVATSLVGDVDIGDRFDKMAISMTNNLRYGTSGKAAFGYVIEKETYIHIRWGFFVVPCFIELLAVVFAVSSMVQNRRSRRVPLWKSSVLAVLACQYENGKLFSTSKDIKRIYEEAEKNEAELH